MNLREQLAALAHEQWSGWMRYVFSKSQDNPDGSVTIPAWAVQRWRRQIETAYADLSDSEKESDLKEADQVLTRIADDGASSRLGPMGIGTEKEELEYALEAVRAPRPWPEQIQALLAKLPAETTHPIRVAAPIDDGYAVTWDDGTRHCSVEWRGEEYEWFYCDRSSDRHEGAEGGLLQAAAAMSEYLSRLGFGEAPSDPAGGSRLAKAKKRLREMEEQNDGSPAREMQLASFRCHVRDVEAQAAAGWGAGVSPSSRLTPPRRPARNA